MKTEYFDCLCDSPEHTVRFALDDDKELYIEVQLGSFRSFYKRVWAAIKYICGWQCRYGHWDVFILNPKDKKRLIDVISKSNDV